MSGGQGKKESGCMGCACWHESYYTYFVHHNWAAAAYLAVILPVAEPAHPVAALNVAAWVEEVCGLNPVLGEHLQVINVVKH
jgi:hypothetical protein